MHNQFVHKYLFHCQWEFTNKSSLNFCISYQVILSFWREQRVLNVKRQQIQNNRTKHVYYSWNTGAKINFCLRADVWLHKAQQRPSFIFLEPDIRAYIPAVKQVTMPYKTMKNHIMTILPMFPPFFHPENMVALSKLWHVCISEGCFDIG